MDHISIWHWRMQFFFNHSFGENSQQSSLRKDQEDKTTCNNVFEMSTTEENVVIWFWLHGVVINIFLIVHYVVHSVDWHLGKIKRFLIFKLKSLNLYHFFLKIVLWYDSSMNTHIHSVYFTYVKKNNTFCHKCFQRMILMHWYFFMIVILILLFSNFTICWV